MIRVRCKVPLVLMALVWSCAGSDTTRAPQGAGCSSGGVPCDPATLGIRVSGNRLLRDGQPFVPLGFTMVGLLSPTGTGTAGTAYQHFGQAEIDAARQWNANTLRFQISQRGFDPQDSLFSAAYVQKVKDGVSLARKNGFVVILSMQDQSLGGGDATPMPEPQTARSWDTVTQHFNGDAYLIYELFNEPRLQDDPANWQIWRNGGDGVVGHQQLVTQIRATGATSVLIVEGLRVGKSFAGCPLVDDPLGQVAYGLHPYLSAPIHTPAVWDNYFGDFSATHPVLATEWSAPSSSSFCRGDWPTVAPQLLDYLKSRNIGMAGAWAFDILDTLIRDWNWSPTTFDGFQCGTSGAGSGDLVRRRFATWM